MRWLEDVNHPLTLNPKNHTMKNQHYRPLSALLGVGFLIGIGDLHPQATEPIQSPPKKANAEAVATNAKEKATTTSTNLIDKLADVANLETNDPFANTFAMLKRATEENPVTSTLNAITGSSDLQLKGTARDAANQALALVEVGSTGVHVVRVGDTLSLSNGGRRSNVTILAIHRQSIEVEYGKFEDSITIR